MDESETDPRRCPLCKEENQCGTAEGLPRCWCFSTPIPASVLDKIPEGERGKACVCRWCASGRVNPAAVSACIDKLMRSRG